MKRLIFSVKDSAAQVFGQPFFAPTQAVAVRSLADEVKRAEGAIASHPEDFELFALGSFDDETGVIVAGAAPSFVVRVKDLGQPGGA